MDDIGTLQGEGRDSRQGLFTPLNLILTITFRLSIPWTKIFAVPPETETVRLQIIYVDRRFRGGHPIDCRSGPRMVGPSIPQSAAICPFGP